MSQPAVTAPGSAPEQPPPDSADLERHTALTDRLLERWGIGEPAPHRPVTAQPTGRGT